MEAIRKGREREVGRETTRARWTEGRLPLARARAFHVSRLSRIPFSFKRLPLGLIDLFTVFFNFSRGLVRENPSIPLERPP